MAIAAFENDLSFLYKHVIGALDSYDFITLANHILVLAV